MKRRIAKKVEARLDRIYGSDDGAPRALIPYRMVTVLRSARVRVRDLLRAYGRKGAPAA